MQFVFGYAGIPSIIYDGVVNSRSHIVGNGAQFISQPLKSNNYYPKNHADFFLQQFAALIAKDYHNELRDTGFALFYVMYEAENSQSFEQRFFPETFTIPLRFHLDYTSRNSINRSKNELSAGPI